MKFLAALLASSSLLLTASHAQVVGSPAADPAAPALAPAQFDVLVSPIALYPDPLVALILPAATHPSDLVLAARFLERGGNPNATGAESWDDSVKALVHYREVIEYLDANLEWTRSLGQAFLDQPDQVMNAIQAVRVRARQSGLLADTPQQEVIVEPEEIRIVPAEPTVIYVPRYDPEIIFVERTYYPSAFFSFGIGYGVGAWLRYDCDWRHNTLRVVHRPTYWYHRPDWRRHHVHRDVHSWTRWTPPTRHPRYHRSPAATHYTVRPERHWDRSRRPGDWNRSHSHRPGAEARPTEWRSDRGPRDHGRRRDWDRRQSAPPVQGVSTPPPPTGVTSPVYTPPVVNHTPERQRWAGRRERRPDDDGPRRGGRFGPSGPQFAAPAPTGAAAAPAQPAARPDRGHRHHDRGPRDGDRGPRRASSDRPGDALRQEEQR